MFQSAWILLQVLSQIKECMLMLQPSLSDSTDCLSTTALCSKPQHWLINVYTLGLPSYFGQSLSLSSCSYSIRHSHLDYQYLTVPPFYSSLYKSFKHFDHSFAFDAPKIWNDLPNDLLPPSGKAQNLPVCKTLTATASISPL